MTPGESPTSRRLRTRAYFDSGGGILPMRKGGCTADRITGQRSRVVRDTPVRAA